MSTDRFADLKPALSGMDADPLQREGGFISLRWRLLVPLFAVLLAGAMIVAYIVTATLVQAGQVGEISQIQLAWQGTRTAMQQVYDDLAGEAARVSFLQGVPEAMWTADTVSLRRLLEPEAASEDLDLLLVVDPNGVELAGLRRVEPDQRTVYAFSSGADLAAQAPVSTALAGGPAGLMALLRLPDGYSLAAAYPVTAGTTPLGYVVVARNLETVLQAMRSGGLGQVALYAADGTLLQTTFDARAGILEALQLTPEQTQSVLAAPNTLSLQTMDLAGYPFEVGYRPFVMGQDVLGVLGVFMPSSLPYAADLARQALSLTMAALAALIVLGGYVVVSRTVMRVERVTDVTRNLAGGDLGARTGLRGADEIGELGRTVDVYANRVQQRQESLRVALRRQRRENARLTAVVESLPDGVVVQDMDGRVLMMNDCARDLLGSQAVFSSGGLGELTAAVTDTLGPALAPGLYALGSPHRIPLAEKILSAQAAAIFTMTGKRVGTVVTLRDITAEVHRDETREALLRTLATDVQEPLLEMVTRTATPDADPALRRLASEVVRSSVRLQRLIAQMHDLADLGPDQLDMGPRPMALDALLSGIVQEWRVAAEASGLALSSRVLNEEMYVLGDERRLRWALGNLLDNALKYTPSGGKVTIVARRESEQVASLVVQDTGIGIQPSDMPHIFTRFFRGTPRTSDGTLLRVPGMGQGLFITRRVIEAHGGTIRVQSQPGRGTQVTCHLPLTSPVTMAVPSSAGLMPASRNTPKPAAASYDTLPVVVPRRSDQPE